MKTCDHPSHSMKMEMRVEEAEALNVSTLMWYKILVRFMGILALALVAIGLDVASDPDSAMLLRKLGPWEIVKPCLIAIPILMAFTIGLAELIRLRQTRKPIGWWLKVVKWGWFRWIRIQTKKIGFIVLLLAAVSSPRQSEAQILNPYTIKACIYIAAAGGGVAVIVLNCDDPNIYLVVEVDDRGRPVPGTWDCSPNTVKTLQAAGNIIRAEGPFNKDDPLGCEERKTINNTNTGDRPYLFPIGPLAKTSKERILMEKKKWVEQGTNNASNSQQSFEKVSEAIVSSDDNSRFVQLSSWSMTNDLSGSDFDQLIPVADVSLRIVIREAIESGTISQSDFQPMCLYRIGVQPVTLCSITTESSTLEGGTTTGDSTVYSGTTNTVTATSRPGYSFVNWTADYFGIPTLVSEDASYTFIAPYEANIALVANFVQVSVGRTSITEAQ